MSSFDGVTPLADMFAAVDRLRALPGSGNDLANLLPEQSAIYAGRPSGDAERLRGYVLASFEQTGLPETAMAFVVEELESGNSPYVVAAAAMVVTTEPGFAQVLSAHSTSISEAEELHRCGEPMFPPTVTIGRGFDPTARFEAFHKQLRGAPNWDLAALFQQKPEECVRQTLSEAGIELKDVARVVITHCSKDEAEAQFMGVLRLPLSSSTWEYGSTVGHLGAADHLVSLDHLLSSGQVGPGDYLLLIGLAPGVTYSCAVIKILATPPWLSDGERGSDD